jgi:anti-sigma factor RsiW
VTCHEVRRLLDAFVDSELGPAESASLRGHLASCVACDASWIGNRSAVWSAGRPIMWRRIACVG